MKTQHQYSTAKYGFKTIAVVVGMLGMVVASSFALLLQQPPSLVRLSQESALTVSPNRAMRNRFFQDEIAAAVQPQLPSGVLAGFNWPERLSDVQPATHHVGMPLSATSNRFFQDEIAAAVQPQLPSGVLDGFSWPERLSDVQPATQHAGMSLPMTSNRFFQDEIAAAVQPQVPSGVLAGFNWPERLSDVQPVQVVVTDSAVVGQYRSVSTNRLFRDEIAGAESIQQDLANPTGSEMTYQRGPR